MKRGDKVKVARLSDYDKMVHEGQYVSTDIGRTGVVQELAYSRSDGDIAYVLMDDTKDLTIWCVSELDIIEE